MSVAREDAAASDAEEVDEVALRDAEEEGAEGDSWGLWDPEAFVLVGERGGVEDGGDDEVFGYVGEGWALVGDC